MAKLCPAGKAAAKKKFDVYPSAYANIWASKYCKGKVGRKKLRSGGLAKKVWAVQSDERIKKMVGRQMGGHWSSEEKREVPTLWEKQRLEEEVSKMRPTCKSHTDDKFAKGECCQTKKSGQ